ncbi:MAG: hypothetical protein M0Z49_02370 [Chloroflexi bacterium]|nr:hypothetical protein [Chloroflexota bacterium]
MIQHTGGKQGTPRTDTSGGGDVHVPVDNETYDLLQALTSKLEAIDAYRTYMQDGSDESAMFRQLAQDDMQHANQLLDALKGRLGNS